MGRSRPSPVSKQRERAQRRAAKHKVCVCGGGGLFAIFAGRGIKITVLFWEMSPSAGIRPKTRSCSPPPPRSRWVMEEQHVEGDGLQEQR